MIISIKTELKTWFHTGMILFTVLFIWGSFIIFALFSISALRTKYQSFEHLEQLISDDKRFEQLLQEPLYDKNGDVNSFLWKKLEIEEMIKSLAPRNAFALCVGVGFYTLPLIMTVIGAMTIFLDVSSNVKRIRASREGKWRYFLSKQAVMLTLAEILTFISISLYMAISHLVFNRAIDIVTSKYIVISDARHTDLRKVILQALFLIICQIIFMEIGFSITFILKLPVVPVTFTGLIWFFNVIPTAYEPKNAVYAIATRISDFCGAVPNGITSYIPLHVATLIVVLMFIIPITALILFWEKKSAYN